jgi:hypothetical protein
LNKNKVGLTPDLPVRAKITLCRETNNQAGRLAVGKPAQHKSFIFLLVARRRFPPLIPVPAAPAPGPQCGLCERLVQRTTRHHLVPREEGGRYGPTVELCQPCHSSVHRFLSNRALARQYATVEALRAAPELQTYLTWIRKQRLERIANRRARRG